MKPGGLVLFRDYGLYDHAMLRFSRGHKVEEHLYFRQDGTLSYFFSTGEFGLFLLLLVIVISLLRNYVMSLLRRYASGHGNIFTLGNV